MGFSILHPHSPLVLIMKISRHSTDMGDYGFHTRCHFCLCLACSIFLTFYMIPAHKRRHVWFGKGPISWYFVFYQTTNTTALKALEMKYNLRNVIHYRHNRISMKIIKGKQEKIGSESYRPTGKSLWLWPSYHHVKPQPCPRQQSNSKLCIYRTSFLSFGFS